MRNRTFSKRAPVGAHRAARTLLASVLLVGPVSAAPPTGADLLRACEAAIGNGFRGIEGQMCSWYATPCACDVAAETELPRVCLPESSTEAKRAASVIAGLKAEPELKQDSAQRAATRILAREFPCDD